jgi:glycine/D-amino acid oxidase-like deaminating enzyme
VTDTDRSVAVVGAGAVGASAALHLAEADATVTVLERDGVASKASGRAAGHLRTYASERRDGITAYSTDRYERLLARHDVPVHRTEDVLLAHTDRGRERLDAVAAAGPDRDRLDPPALRDRHPALDGPDVTGAVVVPAAAHTDPHLATRALADDARAAGARLVRDAVSRLDPSPDDGVALRAGGERRRFDAVVLAAGAWTPELIAPLGTDLPIQPRTSQAVVLDPPRPLDVPMFHCPDLGIYGRGEPAGGVLVGGGSTTRIDDLDAFATDADDSFRRTVATAAPRVATALDDAALVDDWAGRCSSTPDRRPLIGETDHPGLFVCAGFNGGGVARAPFAGRLVADLVLGRPPRFDPGPFAPDRFEDAGVDAGFDVGSVTTDWSPDNA